MSAIDPLALALWAVRLAFLAAILLVLLLVVRALRADLRRSLATAPGPVGRLVVLRSGGTQPVAGTSHPVGAVATLGRDPGATVVVDEPALDGGNLALTFRGTYWVLLGADGSTAIRINGTPAPDAAALGFGDELSIGGTVVRLEHPGPV